MGMKFFCDECLKEIKNHNEYRVENRTKHWETYTFCPECFLKHWQGKLPASPNGGQGGPKEKD
jgi:uncharacterized protein with PIN domain